MIAEDNKYVEKVAIIKDWLKNHPCLPQEMEDVLIRRFIHCVYGDVEKAKAVIEHNLMIRAKNPHVFYQRDPLNPETQNIFETADLSVPIPILTPENYRIIYNGLYDNDIQKYNFNEMMKAFFMSSDIRFKMKDCDEMDINDGEIPVFNLKGFTFKHLSKTVLSTLRLYMKMSQEAFPVRLKQIHIINASPVVEKCLLITRPFMKAKIKQLIHVHLPDSTTLFDYIPKKCLPIEVGGDADITLEEIRRNFYKTLQDEREYLMDEKRWKVRGSSSNLADSESETTNNFKELNID